MSRPLSPAAQAVLDAAVANTEPDCDTQHLIAAALRALADQVVPEEDWPDQSVGFANWNLATERCEQHKDIRGKILAIVAELGGGNG